MKSKRLVRWSARLLTTAAFAVFGLGCNFGFNGWTGGQSTPQGHSAVNFYNCSSYAISVYRRIGNNEYELAGTSGSFQSYPNCGPGVALPVTAELMPGANNFKVLFTHSQCVDNPEIISQCPQEEFTFQGSSSGGQVDEKLTFP